jgi:hypothetical protein
MGVFYRPLSIFVPFFHNFGFPALSQSRLQHTRSEIANSGHAKISVELFLTVSLLFLLRTASAFGQDQDRFAFNDMNKLCRNIFDHKCSQKIEALQLKKYSNLVQRTGKRIILKLGNGKTKVYKDRTKNVDDTSSGALKSRMIFY